jgi:mono/diheme cytochrome c family protein
MEISLMNRLFKSLRGAKASPFVLRRALPVALVMAAASSVPLISASAQGGPAVPAPGTVSSYTSSQASAGSRAYADNCSVCHGDSLGGSAESPPLVGTGFVQTWLTGSPMPFFSFISTSMPQSAPGSLDLDTYAKIAAFIMSRNHIPAGETELPTDTESLTNIVLPPPPAQ